MIIGHRTNFAHFQYIPMHTQARAAAVSQLPLGAAHVGDDLIQQRPKDDVAPECLPEVPSDTIVPHSAAALAGSVMTVLGMLDSSHAQPLGLSGSTIRTTRAALGRSWLPPEHGKGVLLALPLNAAELGVVSASLAWAK